VASPRRLFTFAWPSVFLGAGVALSAADRDPVASGALAFLMERRAGQSRSVNALLNRCDLASVDRFPLRSQKEMWLPEY
jgi:hypothetical protein